MTSHSRCAKDSASCDTKFCLLREHRVLAVSYFLNVVEYVIDNLLKCLSETQGAAVALRKAKPEHEATFWSEKKKN